MSADSADVLRQYLRAWEDADVEAMDRLVGSGFQHVVNGRTEDRSGLLDRVRESDAVLSERTFEIDALVVDGTTVACRCTMTGRHTGAMPLSPPLSEALGIDLIEATERPITVTGMIIAEIQDGRLVSGYGEWDRFAVLTQMLAR